MASHSGGGLHQIVYYDEGVGVGAGVSDVTDALTKYIGGALGRGLDRKIEAAYLFLVLNYVPGDDIYIFGFSRGAYTARSLCGLIRKCGIVRRDCFNQVPVAMRHYRSPAHPDAPDMIEFRSKYAHRRATSPADIEKLEIAPTGDSVEENARARLYQYRSDAMYRMMYVGIWDTVGALGVPGRFDLLRLNRRYRFHDTSASSLLSSIRHGVAANEKRGLYDATLFDNIDALNRDWANATSWNVVDPTHPGFVPYMYRPYQQRWFPGDHCSVGGGYENQRLSSGALLWMAEGASWAGLAFDWSRDELTEAQRLHDPCGSLGANGTSDMPGGKQRATGPAHLDEIAEPTRERYARDPDYAPPNLTVLKGAPRPMPSLPPAPVGFPAP